MATVKQVESLGLLGKRRQDLLDKYNQRLTAGETLTNPEARQYGVIADRQAQLDWEAKNKAYQDALRTRDARAIGGYLGPQSNYNWQQYQQETGLNPASTMAQFMTPLTTDQYKNTFGYDLGQFGKQITGADMAALDPGYQFRLNQGLQALDRSAAARGGVLGGGQLKAAQQYAQDYASGEYGNAWQRQRDLANQNMQNYYQMAGLNRTTNQDIINQYNQSLQNYEGQRANYANLLASRAGAGQTAATNQSQLLQSNAQAMSNALMGYGAASAQNAWDRGGVMNQGIQAGLGAIAPVLGKGITGLAGMFGGGSTGGGSGSTGGGAGGVTMGQIGKYSGLGTNPYGGK